MKVLHITEELEKNLVTIFDAALKAGGFQVHHLIQGVITAIKQEDVAVQEIK